MNSDGYSIGRLDIELPHGKQGSAERIARSAVASLVDFLPHHSISLERLDVPPISSRHGETDRALARRIAEAISLSVLQQSRKGGSQE